MDKKILAIMEAPWHWLSCLYRKQFVTHMDHQPLMYFFAQPNLSSCQLLYAPNLAGFLSWCSIQYT